jgi:hypothetical protein
MAIALISQNIWPLITRAASSSRRSDLVAVAYFGRGGARLLPLRPGSHLVVDASDSTVAAGATCPAELLQLLRRGVRVFSYPGLHAKVFVLGRRAFIGSTNASARSASVLKEAVAEVTEPRMVAEAGAFVRSLCRYELGPRRLRKLQALYRPPTFVAGGGTGKAAKLPRVFWLHKFEPAALPIGTEGAYRDGKREAKRRKRASSFEIDDFQWFGPRSFGTGDVIIQATEEAKGSFVWPPGDVIHVRGFRTVDGKRGSFVYLEAPKRRRMGFERFLAQLPSGARKRLARDGRLSRKWADLLLAALR